MPILLTLLALTGCKGDDTPAWALNYATIYVAEDGIEGTHVWEFFSDRWERKQKEKFYSCAMVQGVVGDVAANLEGCEDCKAVYTISLNEEDGDCADDLAADPALSGIRAFGIGAVPADLADYDPYPGDSFGWYLSFDGETALPHGFAFNEVLDQGGTPDYPGWAPEFYYTLWPAYAWAL